VFVEFVHDLAGRHHAHRLADSSTSIVRLWLV
jgi:hypothetical protein